MHRYLWLCGPQQKQTKGAWAAARAVRPQQRMDENAKKEALRLFTYGLYAVTTGDATRWNAFTANWLSQVSFDPPLVVVSVENASVSLPIIRATGHFAVDVLTAEQRGLAGTLGKSLAKHPGKL